MHTFRITSPRKWFSASARTFETRSFIYFELITNCFTFKLCAFRIRTKPSSTSALLMRYSSLAPCRISSQRDTTCGTGCQSYALHLHNHKEVSSSPGTFHHPSVRASCKFAPFLDSALDYYLSHLCSKHSFVTYAMHLLLLDSLLHTMYNISIHTTTNCFKLLIGSVYRYAKWHLDLKHPIQCFLSSINWPSACLIFYNLELYRSPTNLNLLQPMILNILKGWISGTSN